MRTTHRTHPKVVVVVVVKVQSDRLTITHTRKCVRTQPRQVGEVGRERTHEHTHESYATIVAVREAAPERIERTKVRTKRRESSSPWRLLQPPTHTLTQPINSIGGAHHPHSVVSTRQAATRCDTLRQHTANTPHRPPQRWAIALHHQLTHSEPDSLRSGRVPPAHGSSHSQLTAAEPGLVENVDMSAHVIRQLEYVS